MIGRIVEVADDRRHLFVSRGFMVVKNTEGNREELGQVPLDDIAAVIANAHGLSYTNNLLVALAERGAPFVLCAANHNVSGMLWPVSGNHQQARRIDAQLSVHRPLQKRLWADIIRCKLQQQAAVLEAVNAPFAPLSALAKKVRSGDPDNFEAQGARRYWPLLFGDTFRRDQKRNGCNSQLNYGYTVLRAAMARSVIAAGLHPTLGIHHSNAGNPMRLVDDLMEPFRPIIDLHVLQLQRSGENGITPDSKRALVHTLYDDMQTDSGVTPVSSCMQRLTISLVQIYLGEREKLDLPLPGLPLSLAESLTGD